MSRSTPSLLALLGLVAVAGYQNRDRISDMLSDARQKSTAVGTDPESAGVEIWRNGSGLLAGLKLLFGGKLQAEFKDSVAKVSLS